MPTSLAIRVLVWVWLLGALAVGHFQLLQRLPVSALAGLLLSLTALLLLAYRRLQAFRSWVDAIDLRALVLFHVTRFSALYLLLRYHQGALPYGFAVPAGLGDTVIAAAALVLVVMPLSAGSRERAFYIWNVAGLADLFLVVVSAIRIGVADGQQLAALTVLPLSLLPTFLAPLLIATHVAIFVRLRARQS